MNELYGFMGLWSKICDWLDQGCTNCRILASWLSTFPHFPLISSLSIHFLYQKLSHFVAIKYGTFVVNVKQTYHTRYEKIILGRIRCEKAPQVAPAWGGYPNRLLRLLEHLRC